MQAQDFQKLIDKYLHGKANDKEKKLIEDFLASYQGDPALWNEGSEHKAHKRRVLLQQIQHRIGVKKKPKSSLYFTSRIAVALLLILTVGWIIWSPPQQDIEEAVWLTKTTQWGQKSRIVLSDGTQILLNAGSHLQYPERFTDSTREVILEGEAFFDVTHQSDRPFRVKTKTFTTQVLGTSFNVSDFTDEEAAVTVATGKVRVSAHGSGEKAILLPGMQVRQSAGKMISRKVALEKDLAWKDGIIYFDKLPLKEAILILERWYNVDITLANDRLGNCVIRGKYKEENLVNILESLRFVQEINYTFVDNRKIIISGNGCVI